MKFVFSFVCFFLPLTWNLSQMSMYTAHLQRNVREEEIRLNRQYDAILKEEKNIEKSLQQNEMKLFLEKEYFQLIMLQIQKDNYPEEDRIEKLNATYRMYHRLKAEEKRIDTIKKEKEQEIDENHKKKIKLESLQKWLFENGKDWRGFKNEGHPEPFKGIKGSKKLPIYGSMKADDKNHAFSCLSQMELDLTKSSTEWTRPVPSAYISAGTWQYPQGGQHLGVDFAAPMKSEVVAPANGIILYADAPVSSDNGYLGNWCGWPQGAGNSICMVCSVNEELYIVTFAHLSDEILVFPGQQVEQSALLAHSGNSGNSSGPHTHVEVFRCKTSLQSLVDYFVETSDFSFQNGWDQPATCSSYACRIRPETVF